MSREEEKIGAVRRYLLEPLPTYDVQDGARTHVDRTLLVFHRLDVICTVQITTALLDKSHPSTPELERALQKDNVAAKVLLSPVIYLNHNTLGIAEKSQERR